MNSDASPKLPQLPAPGRRKVCEQFHAEPPPDWQRGPGGLRALGNMTTCRFDSLGTLGGYVAAGTGDLA